MSGVSHKHKDFYELKARVEERGLLKKQPMYQFGTFTTHLMMYAISVALIGLFPHILWLQLINAAFLGFLFTQIAFFGHDSGHKQMSKTVRKNSMIGLSIGALVGVSWRAWVYRHNQHHANPNHEDEDPDLDIPILVFSKKQLEEKHPWFRKLLKYQGIYFPFILPLESLGIRYAGFKYLFAIKKHQAELISMAFHFLVYFGGLFYFLPFWTAVLFIIIHQSVFGIYLGCAFATNHIGMPHVDNDHTLDYVRLQVLTARNIKSTPLITYLYGGLNYQTEHHLFPEVARNKLYELSVIVKDFCEEKNIKYHETTILRSYREVIAHLHAVGMGTK